MTNPSDNVFPRSENSPSSASGRAYETNGGGTHDNAMLSRAADSAHDTVDRVADSVAPHLQRVQEGVKDASDRLQAGAEGLRQAGDEWADTLRTTVREHPLAALGTALALGLVLARLTS